MKQISLSIALALAIGLAAPAGPALAEEALPLDSTTNPNPGEPPAEADTISSLDTVDLDTPPSISYDPIEMSKDCSEAGLAIGNVNMLKECNKPSE